MEGVAMGRRARARSRPKDLEMEPSDATAPGSFSSVESAVAAPQGGWRLIGGRTRSCFDAVGPTVPFAASALSSSDLRCHSVLIAAAPISSGLVSPRPPEGQEWTGEDCLITVRTLDSASLSHRTARLAVGTPLAHRSLHDGRSAVGADFEAEASHTNSEGDVQLQSQQQATAAKAWLADGHCTG